MKLFYWESTHGNVGDDINPWLWKRMLPDEFNDDNSTLFIGIGTLLNHHIPEAKRYIVATSGFGYGEKPNINNQWEFIGVRGPRTIEALGLPKDTLTLDGAYLLSKYLDISNIGKKHEVSYIPHVFSMKNADWEHFSALTGFNVIDPRLSVEAFVTALAQSERVVCEAMHGAIIADTFGIPWQPVKMYDHINENKWFDWTESFSLPIQFSYAEPIWIGDKKKSSKTKLKNTIKRTLSNLNVFTAKFDAPPPKTSSNRSLRMLAEHLKQLQQRQFYLTDRVMMEEKLDKLIEVIEKKFGHKVCFEKIAL